MLINSVSLHSLIVKIKTTKAKYDTAYLNPSIVEIEEGYIKLYNRILSLSLSQKKQTRKQMRK